MAVSCGGNAGRRVHHLTGPSGWKAGAPFCIFTTPGPVGTEGLGPMELRNGLETGMTNEDGRPARRPPRISVVTPTFNAEKTLTRTMDSVLGQGYPGLEYIVVDGGSKDGTLALVQGRQGISRWVSEQDKGIYDAMNKGVRMAGGDWIGILNADDAYMPGVLARVADLSLQHPEVEVFYSDLRMVYGNRPPYFLRSARRLEVSSFWRMPVWHPTMFVRRDVYARAGLFAQEFRIAGDYELVLRFFLKNVRFMHVDEQWVEMSGGGASDVRWRDGKRELEAIARMHGVFSGNLRLLYRLDFAKVVLSEAIAKVPGLRTAQYAYRKVKSVTRAGF